MILPATAIVVVAVAALLIAGSRHVTVRTASADAPNQITIAKLRPGHAVCEGPITSQGSARSVGIWGSAVASTARLTVAVKDPSTHETVSLRLASGRYPAQGNGRPGWRETCPETIPSRSA